MEDEKNGHTKQATAKALAEEREVAQPSRFVKDKRQSRAFGCLHFFDQEIQEMLTRKYKKCLAN